MDGINLITSTYKSDVGQFTVGDSPVEGTSQLYQGDPSAIGYFNDGFSPIEGPAFYYRGPYSSAIGLFCIGRSPIGLTFVPVPDRRRVVFLLPEYLDAFDMPELEDEFVLPAPEGWSY